MEHMTSPKKSDNLHWLLLKTSLRAKQRLIKIAEEHDLTIMQAYSLLLLEPNEQVPMNSISGILGCDPSNVTGIVDYLVNNTYIERKENPSDRRIKEISLTTKGSTVRQKLLDRLQKDDVPEIEGLTDSETTSLQKILLKILGE